ncbi:MAG: universal stress protein [Burkholderiales bacterium]|nr:universal stress protein [Burkholderiales bacterium]
MYKNILLPTDGSALAMKGVRAGIAFARSLGAKVTTFYANPGIGFEFAQVDAPLPEEVLAAELARLKKVEERYLAAVRKLAEASGVACTCVSTTGRTAYEGIIAAAKKQRCDLICMASHGRSGIKGVLLGSVAQKVLTHSKIPVLIMRA